MRDHLIRSNIVLTIPLRAALQQEANRKCGGNISLLVRALLAHRYKLLEEIDPELRAAKWL